MVGRITALERYGDFVNENRIRITRLKVFGIMMIPSCMKPSKNIERRPVSNSPFTEASL